MQINQMRSLPAGHPSAEFIHHVVPQGEGLFLQVGE